MVADRITILRDGRLVASDNATAFDRQKIIQAMVGRTLTDEIYSGSIPMRAPRKRGAKVLSVENLSMGNMVATPPSRSTRVRSPASSDWSAPAGPKR